MFQMKREIIQRRVSQDIEALPGISGFDGDPAGIGKRLDDGEE